MIFTPFKYSQNESGGWQNTGWLSNFTSQVKEAQQAFKLLDAKTADDWITKFNKDTHEGTQNLTKFFETCKDPSLVNYLNNLKGGKATVEGYTAATKSANAAIEATGTASKAASIGMKALAVAENVGIWLVVTLAIQGVVKGIEYLVTAQQRAIDKANELTSTYNSNIETINSNITTLQSLQDEFTTLSKGVDNNGKNVGLSADQFKRYHEIVKQITDISPTLIKGYDSEGNAIVNKNTALSESIKLQQQELDLEKKKYLDGADDVVKGAKAETSRSKGNVKKSDSGEYGFANGIDFVNAIGGQEKLNALGLDYQKIIMGDNNEIQKVVTMRSQIIDKLQTQNNLSDEQKDKISQSLDILEKQVKATQEANKTVVDLVNTWGSLEENSSWFNDISNGGFLQEFDKSIEKLINDNPSMTFDQIKNEAEKLGNSFGDIKNKIPLNEISKLKSELSKGNITGEEYNRQLESHIKSIENLATKYKKTNPVLAEFLQLLSKGFADFVSTGSDSKVITDLSTATGDLQSKTQGLSGAYKDFQTISDVVNGKRYLTLQQVSDLVSAYPDLEKNIKLTTSGWTLESGAIDVVSNSMTGLQSSMITAQKAMNDATSSGLANRLKVYGIEINAIKSLADAMGAIGNNETLSRQYKALAMFGLEDSGAKSEAGQTINLLRQFGDAQDAINKAQQELKTAQNKGLGVTSKADKDAAKKSKKKQKEIQYENKALEAQIALLEHRKNVGEFTSKDQAKQVQLNLAYVRATENLKKYAKISSEIQDIEERTYSAYQTYYSSLEAYQKQQYEDAMNVIDKKKEANGYDNNELQMIKDLTEAERKYAKTTDEIADAQSRIKEATEDLYTSRLDKISNDKDLGLLQDGSLEAMQRIKEIKDQLINGDLKLVNSAEKQLELDKQLYSEQRAYNENQINYVDYLVSVGKMQENSLDYVRRLNNLYKTLNLSLEERQSLQEKIFSAEKSYIQNLESEIMDESIEGSYGYRIKEIQDEIDAINNKTEAESKQLALEKAKAAFEEAQQQKTTLIYHANSGFQYEASQSDINEKQEVLANAERDLKIEKLNQQKNSIQQEADDLTSKLEKTLKKLDGTNKVTWENVQNEVEKVIKNVRKVFKSHTTITKQEHDELDASLEKNTQTTTSSYETQLKDTEEFTKKLDPLSKKLIDAYESMAASVNKMAAAMERLGVSYLNSESRRETANDRYNEYNQATKKSHQTVKYASGTNDSIGGWAITNEKGYEAKLVPIDGGNYTWLPEHSKVFDANTTENMAWLSKSPQINMIKNLLSGEPKLSAISNSVSNSKDYNIDMNGANFNFPNVIDGQSLINELKNFGSTVEQFVNRNKR
ncbi:protein of unknown function [Ruminococcaceae bacterium BL-6]|nr:protein of unknown function [Ruminococcaceae bacterium BL-6]